MFNIKESTDYYIKKGYELDYATSKVSQDIILSCIAKSTLRKNVTIKGGVVLFNITGDKRRATEDIDIDFIRYSLEDESIERFFNKLKNKELGILFKLASKPKSLNHEDYKGKRVFINIVDSFQNNIEVKIDIGVQSDLSIKQEEYLFNFEFSKDKLTLQINSKEQIFVEKLASFIKHGIRSTRYKDIYDFYYFISESKLDDKKVLKLIDSYILGKKPNIRSVSDIYNELNLIFDNRMFLNSVKDSKYNWIEVDSNLAIKTVLDYIKSIEGLLIYE